MSAPPAEDPTTKAGHPPAVKVAGGVRITQHHKPEHKSEWTKEDDELVAAAQAVPTEERNVVVSGAQTKGDKDFPKEAVKAFHDKPQPTHQQPHVHGVTRHIQQPRK